MEVEVVPGNLSLVRLVTTESGFAREDDTRLVTDQNAALNRGGGGEKSTGAEGGGWIAHAESCRGIEGQCGI